MPVGVSRVRGLACAGGRARDASSDRHKRLHRHRAFAAFLAGRPTGAGYRALLARPYGFPTPLGLALLASAVEIASAAQFWLVTAELLELTHDGSTHDR